MFRDFLIVTDSDNVSIEYHAVIENFLVKKKTVKINF